VAPRTGLGNAGEGKKKWENENVLPGPVNRVPGEEPACGTLREGNYVCQNYSSEKKNRKRTTTTPANLGQGEVNENLRGRSNIQITSGSQRLNELNCCKKDTGHEITDKRQELAREELGFSALHNSTPRSIDCRKAERGKDSQGRRALGRRGE